MVWQILIYLVGGGKQVGEKEGIKAEHRRLFCLPSAWGSNPPLAVVSVGAKIRAQILPLDPSASMRFGRQSVEVGHLSLSTGRRSSRLLKSLSWMTVVHHMKGGQGVSVGGSSESLCGPPARTADKTT